MRARGEVQMKMRRRDAEEVLGKQSKTRKREEIEADAKENKSKKSARRDSTFCWERAVSRR
jgi:hypothetical protein